MVKGILIGLIAIFTLCFYKRGLRSGSSFIYERYTGANRKVAAPRGFGRTGEKGLSRKRRGFGAPLEGEKKNPE